MPCDELILNSMIEGDAIRELIAGERGKVTVFPVKVAVKPETTNGKGVSYRSISLLESVAS
jgi:hypothetical protein